MNLLDDDILERSAVVANCRMNRERNLVGSNGYDKELGLNPLDFLRGRVASGSNPAWLDLCCGTGKALIEAARIVHAEGLDSRIGIVGVDLVGMFLTPEPGLDGLRLVEASLNTWRPEGQFDLITCVHGLHYIGDKLGLIARAASWLVEDGRFVTNLSLENVNVASDPKPARKLAAEIRRTGLEFDRRRPNTIDYLPGPEDSGPALRDIPDCRRSGRAELHGASRRELLLRDRLSGHDALVSSTKESFDQAPAISLSPSRTSARSGRETCLMTPPSLMKTRVGQSVTRNDLPSGCPGPSSTLR